MSHQNLFLLYNKRRTLDEFIDYIGAWHYQEFHPNAANLLRRDMGRKILMEEAMPIFRYINLFHQNSNYHITTIDGNQNHDAILTKTSGEIFEYIEVTCAPMANDHILRKELSDHGHISIETQAALLRDNPSLEAYAETVLEKITKKHANQYPRSTILLVEVASEIICEDRDNFEQVISHIRERIHLGQFKSIIIFPEGGRHYYTKSHEEERFIHTEDLYHR